MNDHIFYNTHVYTRTRLKQFWETKYINVILNFKYFIVIKVMSKCIHLTILTILNYLIIILVYKKL